MDNFIHRFAHHYLTGASQLKERTRSGLINHSLPQKLD